MKLVSFQRHFLLILVLQLNIHTTGGTAVIPVRVTNSTSGYIVAVAMGTAHEILASQHTLWHTALDGSYQTLGPF